jgi:hypothetical protein
MSRSMQGCMYDPLINKIYYYLVVCEPIVCDLSI